MAMSNVITYFIKLDTGSALPYTHFITRVLKQRLRRLKPCGRSAANSRFYHSPPASSAAVFWRCRLGFGTDARSNAPGDAVTLTVNFKRMMI
jgi:hypothetical protein